MSEAVNRDDVNKLFKELGDLGGQVRQLTSSVLESREESQREHRKVHDIVDAMSSSMRVIASSVEQMAPHVDRFRLKESHIDDAIKLAKEYHEARAEDRGMEKSAAKARGMIYAICGAGGAGFGAFVNWLLGARPHP